MLCSIRVRVRSTNSMPSSLERSTVGARFSRIARGVDSQCVAFCSSPNTATAWAITGTRRATTIGDVTILFYCEIAGPRPSLSGARPIPEGVGLAAGGADHDADQGGGCSAQRDQQAQADAQRSRSEEHTSELQSPMYLV